MQHYVWCLLTLRSCLGIFCHHSFKIIILTTVLSSNRSWMENRRLFSEHRRGITEGIISSLHSLRHMRRLCEQKIFYRFNLIIYHCANGKYAYCALMALVIWVFSLFTYLLYLQFTSNNFTFCSRNYVYLHWLFHASSLVTITAYLCSGTLNPYIPCIVQAKYIEPITILAQG